MAVAPSPRLLGEDGEQLCPGGLAIRPKEEKQSQEVKRGEITGAQRYREAPPAGENDRRTESRRKDRREREATEGRVDGNRRESAFLSCLIGRRGQSGLSVPLGCRSNRCNPNQLKGSSGTDFNRRRAAAQGNGAGDVPSTTKEGAGDLPQDQIRASSQMKDRAKAEASSGGSRPEGKLQQSNTFLKRKKRSGARVNSPNTAPGRPSRPPKNNPAKEIHRSQPNLRLARGVRRVGRRRAISLGGKVRSSPVCVRAPSLAAPELGINGSPAKQIRHLPPVQEDYTGC